MNYIKVMTDVQLAASDPNDYEEGDIVDAVYPSGDRILYMKEDNTWKQLSVLDENSETRKLNVYQLNKSMIMQTDLMTIPEQKKKEKMITDWAKDNGNYFLLYGKEISYFTLFRKYQFPEYTQETLGEAVLSCLRNLGYIYSIDIDLEKEAIEIWVKHDDEPTLLYLLKWDEGVVSYCG